ncbi:MAG: hypothetical protein ACLFSQ_02445 [Candidatus Zixiibacteriota bacterium]
MQNYEKESQYRQFLAAKALYYAINGDEGRSESIRFFLRKIGQKEENIKEIQFPMMGNNSCTKKAA